MEQSTVETYAVKLAERNGPTSVCHFATPANRYPYYDRRRRDVVGYLVSYTWTVEPFTDVFGNPGIVPEPERRYVLVSDECGKWIGDMFLVDDGTSVEPFYVGAYRLSVPADRPDLDDGIDPHLVLCPLRSETAYGAMDPCQCHHVITWALGTPRTRGKS